MRQRINRRLFLAGTAGLAAGGLLAEAPDRTLSLGMVEAAALTGPWPDQAVLFDGSTGSADTYYDALSQVGILTDLLGFLYSCGSTSQQMSGGVIKLAAGPAVYQSVLNVGPYITPTAPPPSILPPPLLVAKNDCDLLLAIGDVEQYVQSITSQTQVLLSQIQACRDRARVLWCEVVTAAEQAALLPPLESVLGFIASSAASLGTPGTGFAQSSQAFPGGCNQGVQALVELPGSLNQLAFRRLSCEKVEIRLTTMQAKLTALVSQFGGLWLELKQGFYHAAASNLATAEEHLASAEAIAAAIDALKTLLSAQSLAASCALCGGQVVFSPPRPSGAVTIDAQRQPLDRLVRSLASAAAQSPDRVYGARLRDFAQRLARVPDNRVYNVIFPSVSRVGQQFLALRAEGQADDRSLPRVVLLTAMPRDARLPPMNVEDLRLLFRAFRVFDQMLRIGVP
jgi:hypothetical protein